MGYNIWWCSDALKEYIDVLIDAIAEQIKDCDQLVVAQALYMEEDRKDIKSFLEALGYNVRMFWVRTPWWRNIQNLLTREKGWRWVYYWLINKPFFQKPKHEHGILYNTWEK